MSFVSGMLRAIKRSLSRLRADKQLSGSWTEGLVKYFPKEATIIVPSEGLHQLTGCGLLTLAFFYTHFSSVSRGHGRF